MNTNKTENGKRKTENTNSLRLRLSFFIFRFPFSVKLSVSICVYLWFISLCFFLPARKTNAQVRPVYDYGAIGLGQLLKRLNTTKSVMMIGAHPDDEDSALLAYLARGENARTAYLSLTRGDGGQNIIGSELFESLGVIRTEELLQARRLDGAEQYFTRAFDYGFSKTLAEAKQKWDEKVILCDTVRAIRMFRPLVIISRFSGTPADGHGQHQYAGYISPLAVRAAADANQCKESGAAWQVLKFYVGQGFRSEAQPTLRINTGEYDYLLGRSYSEIAAEGRSQHKTQEQGGLELKGERFSGLNLIESKVPKVAKETSVFDGIDTSLNNIADLFSKDKKIISDFTKTQLNIIQQSLERATKEYNPNAPQQILRSLIEAQKAAGKLVIISFPGGWRNFKSRQEYKQTVANESEISFIAYEKHRQIIDAVRLAAGIQVETLANQETVTQNENFLMSVKVFYPKNPNVKFKEIKLNAPDDWQISHVEERKNNLMFSQFSRENAKNSNFFNIKVSPNENFTQPYFLEKPRDGYLYNWSNSVDASFPFEYPIVNSYSIFEIYGESVSFSRTIEYRFADDIRGEIRRDLNVVPKISLSLDQKLLVVPQSKRAQTRKIVLSITNNSSSATNGEARLNLPQELKVSPRAANFNLKDKGEKTSLAFDITIPAEFKTGDFELGAQATAGGETFTKTLNEIAYPHIQTHRFYTDAKAKVAVLDLKAAPVRVGYIMGSGDDVPEAIRQMGLTVDLLNENDLTGGDLSRFDTIVVGIRAYQVRRDLISNNQRILDYVKNGGTLIVQYQRPDYVQQNLQPFPASMTDTHRTTAGTTARVVDENAKVTILDARNPVFNFPNKITDADFSGWVQERNLYNFTTFDQKYTPLLESHDAGELENKGGLVIAEIGKGKYVYCSYAFFRQLPAGVSGAYRLFANLLSLPNSKS